MAELTVEQRRALAVAGARARAAVAAGDLPASTLQAMDDFARSQTGGMDNLGRAASEQSGRFAERASDPRFIEENARRFEENRRRRAYENVQGGIRAVRRGTELIPQFHPDGPDDPRSQQIDERFAREHPTLAPVLETAGGVAASAPLAALFTALGGASLPGQMLAGGLTGAGIPAVQTAARGGSWGDIGRAAAWGGAAGAAFPLATRGVSKFIQLVRGATPKASGQRLFAGRAAPDFDLERFSASAPELSPMDQSDSLRALGRAVAGNEGPAQNTLRQFAQGRAVLEGQMDDALDDLAGRMFPEALRPAGPVNVQPVLDAIDQDLARLGSADARLRRELLSLRNLIRDNGDDAVRLHEMRWRQAQRAGRMAKSASGTEAYQGGALGRHLNRLTDQIDQASSGAYRAALREYAVGKQRIEAISPEGPTNTAINDAIQQGYTREATRASTIPTPEAVFNSGMSRVSAPAIGGAVGGVPGVASVLAVQGARRGLDKIFGALGQARNLEAARLLTASPSQADEIAIALAGKRGLPDATQRMINALLTTGEAQAAPRLTGPRY